MINTINICRSMLENLTVRNGFMRIAKEYSQKYENAWFIQEANDGHKWDMSRVFDDFNDKIQESFPVVFVDETCDAEVPMVATHFGIPWSGTFQPSTQCITVNGGVS